MLRQPLGGNDFSTSDFSFTRGHRRGPTVLPLLREAARLDPVAGRRASPVERAGLDEDQRLAGRRLAAARRMPAPTRTTWSSAARAYLRRGRPGARADRAERAELLAAGVPRDDAGRRAAAHPAARPPRRRRCERAGLPAAPVGARRQLRPVAGRRRAARPTRPPAQAVYGVAFHCYRGDVSALRELRDRHPGRRGRRQRVQRRRVVGRVRRATCATRRARCWSARSATARAWLVKWNLALDPHGRPARTAAARTAAAW